MTLIAASFRIVLLALAALLPIINPPGSAPIFLSMTPGAGDPERSVLARRIAVSSAFLLIGALVVGSAQTEPLPADHPLWDMADRVLITPHVAGYSPRIAERHLAQLVENVRRFVAGEPLQNVVDKAEWF